jgi:serine/threonine protein phosphatase 1
MSIALDRQSFALPRSGAADTEIFAIGDIHGRTDLLVALLDAAQAEPRRADRREIVFTGDLIDRGPDSLGAIDLTIGASAHAGADSTTVLMGNHESLMRLVVDPATPESGALDALQTWSANGGDRVMAEFVASDRPPANLRDLRDAVRASLPLRIARWLQGLRPHWRSGELLFVHAGVHPRAEIETFLATPWNVPLNRLVEDRHWAWIRAPFLECAPGPDGWSGAFVLHGHTPNDGRVGASHADQIRRFRLNLDAGSGQTGVAKMAILRGATVDVVTARGATNRDLRG